MGIMRLSEIMDRSVDVLKKNIKSILVFTLTFGAIEIGGLIALVLFGGLLGLMLLLLTKSYIMLIVMLVVVLIIYFTVIMSQNIGLIKIASQEFLDEKVTFGSALGTSFKNIHKVFGIIVIEVIMFAPLIAGLIGLFYLSFNSITFSYISANFVQNNFMVIILYLLEILAAVFLTFLYKTFFTFSLHVLTIEKKGFISAVKRSFFLVKSNLWKVFGYQLLFYLTILAIDTSIRSLVALFFSLLYFLLRLINSNLNYLMFLYTSVNALSMPLSLLTFMVITPLGNIMITMLYFNLKFKKEGYDLELKLKSLQKKQETRFVGNARYDVNTI